MLFSPISNTKSVDYSLDFDFWPWNQLSSKLIFLYKIGQLFSGYFKRRYNKVYTFKFGICKSLRFYVNSFGNSTPNKWRYVLYIVAAFQGMHVSPAKHSYAWLPRKRDFRTDTQTDGQTDAGQSDPYVPLCFAGDTIKKKKSSLIISHVQIIEQQVISHENKLSWLNLGCWPHENEVMWSICCEQSFVLLCLLHTVKILPLFYFRPLAPPPLFREQI